MLKAQERARYDTDDEWQAMGTGLQLVRGAPAPRHSRTAEGTPDPLILGRAWESSGTGPAMSLLIRSRDRRIYELTAPRLDAAASIGNAEPMLPPPGHRCSMSSPPARTDHGRTDHLRTDHTRSLLRTLASAPREIAGAR
jgi:hypothetical protein